MRVAPPRPRCAPRASAAVAPTSCRTLLTVQSATVALHAIALLALARRAATTPTTAQLHAELAAAVTTKNVSLASLRAHTAGWVATLPPDTLLAAIAKPRTPPYPVGACVACALTPPCPGWACDATPCSSYVYAGARATRARADCVSDFPATCASPPNVGCTACALWREINTRCAPHAVGVDTGSCVSRGEYALTPAREVEQVGAARALCATARQWLLVPTRACTGAESEDALCTGSAAELLWGAAFDEAEATGLGPPLATRALTVWDATLPAGVSSPWGVIVNAANRRSQHQTHYRLGAWRPAAPPSSFGGTLLPHWLTTDAFSVDASAPTLTGPGPQGPDPFNETQAPLLATVFVATPPKPDAAAAKPWATAATVAAAVDAARPYGVLVAPKWQPVKSGGPRAAGVAVAAVFDTGASQLLDETITLTDCIGLCDNWRQLTPAQEAARVRPPPLGKSWAVLQEARGDGCDLPSPPPGVDARDWYQRLGVSW